ncbi:hypothetical protein JA521_01975 [Klebsiella pneumoniae]|nr:hypothetical protein [Klebsiella pneumoniae]
MKISHPRDDRPVIGGMTTNTDLDSLQKSESKTTKADEKNSLLLSHSNRRESPEMDLDELLRKFDISTVKNKPANGVFFLVLCLILLEWKISLNTLQRHY